MGRSIVRKIFGVYSPSHEVLLNDWLLPTLGSGFEVNFRRVDQFCPSARFMDKGWVGAVSQKIWFLLDVLRGMPAGEVFIFSDVDIQWFGSAEDHVDGVLEMVSETDMLFHEDAFGEFCTGFFLCRANHRVERFWRAVLGAMGQIRAGDQRATNNLLREGASSYVSAGLLPRKFWGPGCGRADKSIWRPGIELEVPEGIAFHHANWTVGVENKRSQLQYVRSILETRN